MVKQMEVFVTALAQHTEPGALLTRLEENIDRVTQLCDDRWWEDATVEAYAVDVVVPWLVFIEKLSTTTLSSGFNKILREIHGDGSYTGNLAQHIFQQAEAASPDLCLSAMHYVYLITTRFRDLAHAPEVGHCCDLISETVPKMLAKSVLDSDTIRSLERSMHAMMVPVEQARKAALQQEQRDEEATRRKARRAVAPKVPRRAIAYDGPGNLSVSGSRHGNDHVDFRDIQILPSSEELLAEREPFLPQNTSHGRHFIEGPYSSARHLDTHFRLMRHEKIAPLRESIAAFKMKGGVQSVKGDRFRGNNVGDLFLFRNARVIRIGTDKVRGLVFKVIFDPPSLLINKSKNDREKYWEQTKRLQLGAPICLWTELDGQLSRLIIGEVASRNMGELLGTADDKRPVIGVSCSGEDIALMGNAMLHDDGRWTLLQDGTTPGGDVAVLQRLQSMGDEGAIPFEHLILPQARPETIEPPGFLSEGASWDLSIILTFCPSDEVIADDCKLRQAKGRLKRIVLRASRFVEATPRDTVIDALTEYTTLDEAQSVALWHALVQEVVLIQGPPGTGKTFLGILLVLIILANTKPTEDNLWEDDALARFFGDSKHGTPAIGPVVAVCYTNHALDQFLEGMIDHGIEDIIRVGRRSKNEKLMEREMITMSRGTATKHQRWQLAQAYAKLDELEMEIEYVSDSLASDLTWQRVEDYLLMNAPVLWRAFSDAMETEDGFRRVTCPFSMWMSGSKSPHGASKQGTGPTKDMVDLRNAFSGLMDEGMEDGGPPAGKVNSQQEAWQKKKKKKKKGFRPLGELDQCEDVWSMGMQERRLLINSWKRATQEGAICALESLNKQFKAARRQLDEVLESVNMAVLRTAAIVGVTTSGMARYQNLFASLGAKVVMCEEAAEVLEGHTLACLTKSTEHLICIGDHLQLRPKTECYNLTREHPSGYNLDVSLFERLVNDNFPVVTLEQQRRMHPDISALIQKTLYPNLRDHSSVLYPQIPGMGTRLHFFSHNMPEDGAGRGAATESNSRSNTQEARIVIAFTQYLLRQGFAENEITILTPYVGQLLRLRNMLSNVMQVFVDDRDAEDLKDLEDGEDDVPLPEITRTNIKNRVRLATIDNFQGEESRVILLSLVRCNQQGNIGFLKTSNRINVALSRAMHGMYIFGDSDALLAAERKSPMWTQVITQLIHNGACSPCLPLKCQNHPEICTSIQSVEDFERLAGDGGCATNCPYKIPSCGHRCPRRCHPDDRGHVATFCPKPCTRIRPKDVCPAEHPCNKVCGEECGNCLEIIPSTTLPCGHNRANLRCWEAQAPERVRCKITVSVVMPLCGHTTTLACHTAARIEMEPEVCGEPCGGVHPCGHPCTQKCGQCIRNTKKERGGEALLSMGDVVHVACRSKCSIAPFCGHECGKECHSHDRTKCKTATCKRPCTASCVHSQCNLECWEACAPCAEPCVWRCKHRGACTMPCGAPCNRLPCNEQCDKVLSCGHRCPGLCGEECPDASNCLHCRPSLGDEIVDLIMMTTRQQHDCSVDPLLFLTCGHVLCMSTLDGLMEMAHLYACGDDGNWKAPMPLQWDMLSDVKTCPHCRAPSLGSMRRYGRSTNRSFIDLSQKKYVKSAALHLADASKYLVDARRALEDTPGMALKYARIASKMFQRVQQIVPPALQIYQAVLATSTDIKTREHIGVPLPDKQHLLNGMVGVSECEHLIMLATPAPASPDGIRQVDGCFQRANAALKRAIVDAVEGKSLRTARHARLTRATIIVDYVSLRENHRCERLQLAGETDMKDSQLALLQQVTILLQQIQSNSREDIERCGKLAFRVTRLKTRVETEATYGEVTAKERKEIFEVMSNDVGRGNGGFGGHWYKCTNGHVYTIGECGGAMQQSTCPECGAVIGGGRHRLAEGNAEATEFLRDI